MNFTTQIKKNFQDSIRLKQQLLETIVLDIASASELIIKRLAEGKKILLCGNGGSAADAQHFSSELLNRYEKVRPGLPAISLTGDGPTLTSIANDFDYTQVFSKQISALGNRDDILIVLSTSGLSENIVKAVDAAHVSNMTIVAFNGKNGGKISPLLKNGDIEILVSSESTARIQEAHILIVHCICELIDFYFDSTREKN